MEAVHDFWRRRIADPSCPPALAAYLRQKRDTPEKYAKLLARSLAKPLAKHLWPAGLEVPVSGERQRKSGGKARGDTPAATIDLAMLTEAYRAAARIWSGERDGIVALVKASIADLNKSSYSEPRIDGAAWRGTPISGPLRRSHRSTRPRARNCCRLRF